MKKRGKDFFNPQGKPLMYGVGLFVLLMLLLKATVTIPAGYVGLKDFFGNVADETLPAGFHIVNPLLKIHKVDIRTQELSEKTDVPSKEGLNISLDVTLLYSVDPKKAANVFKTIGPFFQEKVVTPQFRSVVRGATAGYEAKALYTSAREIIAEDMIAQLKPLLDSRGIRVENVLLRNVMLPEFLSKEIEEKLQEEQRSEKMKFVLLKESQEAERKRIEAKGIADFQKIVAAGLTSDYLQWKGIETTEKLAGSNNTKVVVIGSGKNGLPLILGGEK